MATCPACGAELEAETVASVNADRRPDLRDAILDGSFQAVMCDECGVAFRLPPRFTYADFERGQWFVAHPGDDQEAWPRLEALAGEVFEATFGPGAPSAVRN